MKNEKITPRELMKPLREFAREYLAQQPDSRYVPADAAHKDQILPMMAASRRWDLPTKNIVHVIDREAGSLGHWRQWDKAGHLFLVRSDDRYVTWENRTLPVREIVAELAENGRFLRSREVEYHGKKRPGKSRKSR